MAENNIPQKGEVGNENLPAENPDLQNKIDTYAAVGFQDPHEVTRKDKTLISTIVIIIMVVLALALVGFLSIKQPPETVQGQGEATEIRVSGKLPGRVAAIYVEEGQKVKAGDTLVHITSQFADAQLDEARAMEEVARATNRKVDAGTRPQVVNAAREIWMQARAAWRLSTAKAWSAHRSETRRRPPTTPPRPASRPPGAAMSSHRPAHSRKTAMPRPRWST